MNAAMSGLLVAMLIAASVPVAANAREHRVDQRQHNQQQRIHEGWRQGDLTRGETRRLQREARDIRRDERAFRSDGRFAPAERRHVQRDLDRLSRDIHRERHDGERRFGHEGNIRNADRWPHRGWQGHQYGYGPSREFDRRVDHIQHRQRQRIVQGIRTGELTRHEARRLMTEQRAIEAEERRYLADGFLTRWERMDLMGDLNAAGRHIYNEAHDAQTRR